MDGNVLFFHEVAITNLTVVYRKSVRSCLIEGIKVDCQRFRSISSVVKGILRLMTDYFCLCLWLKLQLAGLSVFTADRFHYNCTLLRLLLTLTSLSNFSHWQTFLTALSDRFSKTAGFSPHTFCSAQNSQSPSNHLLLFPLALLQLINILKEHTDKTSNHHRCSFDPSKVSTV